MGIPFILLFRPKHSNSSSAPLSKIQSKGTSCQVPLHQPALCHHTPCSHLHRGHTLAYASQRILLTSHITSVPGNTTASMMLLACKSLLGALQTLPVSTGVKAQSYRGPHLSPVGPSVSLPTSLQPHPLHACPEVIPPLPLASLLLLKNTSSTPCP